MQLRNPYDDAIIAEITPTSDQQVHDACRRARAAFADWRTLPLAERAARVRRGADWFRAHKEQVAREITLQMGKPIAQARHEVDTMVDRAEHMLAIAAAALAPEVLPQKPGFTRRIEHEPLGVVLDLAAWNYPLLIAVNVVVPALLAGNVVLLKHSARTALCGRQFAAAFPNVFELQIDHEQTARLIRSGELDHVAFTGSVDGGRHVYRQVAEAPRFLDVGLELGGKDPAYVAADADLEFTVPNVVEGATYNTGQSCCAVERVYVHERQHAAFLERARAEFSKLRLGDPLDPATTIGPLASRAQVTLLAGRVQQAVQRGARLLCGGTAWGDRGQFLLPALLDGCPNDSELMQEESFGPLLPVLKVRDDDEALRLMNDSRFGLTASVWTRDRARAERFAAGLQAGTVFQNRCDYLDPALPWTGVGESGKGSTLSRWGFAHLTRRKAIHFRD